MGFREFIGQMLQRQPVGEGSPYSTASPAQQMLQAGEIFATALDPSGLGDYQSVMQRQMSEDEAAIRRQERELLRKERERARKFSETQSNYENKMRQFNLMQSIDPGFASTEAGKAMFGDIMGGGRELQAMTEGKDVSEIPDTEWAYEPRGKGEQEAAAVKEKLTSLYGEGAGDILDAMKAKQLGYQWVDKGNSMIQVDAEGNETGRTIQKDTAYKYVVDPNSGLVVKIDPTGKEGASVVPGIMLKRQPTKDLEPDEITMANADKKFRSLTADYQEAGESNAWYKAYKDMNVLERAALRRAYLGDKKTTGTATGVKDTQYWRGVDRLLDPKKGILQKQGISLGGKQYGWDDDFMGILVEGDPNDQATQNRARQAGAALQQMFQQHGVTNVEVVLEPRSGWAQNDGVRVRVVIPGPFADIAAPAGGEETIMPDEQRQRLQTTDEEEKASLPNQITQYIDAAKKAGASDEDIVQLMATEPGFGIDARQAEIILDKYYAGR